MSDYYQAQLQARKIMDDTGMALDEVLKLDMTEYARLTGRSLKFTPEPVPEPPAAPAAPDSAFTETATSPEPVGIDPDSPEFFHVWRAQRVSGGEGKGIFDSVGSQSAEYRAAAARQAGRTGWANSNTIEPPRIEGRYLHHDEGIDPRPAHARLSNPANLWQGR